MKIDQKYTKILEKVGKAVLKGGLAVAAVAIVGLINNELGQFGIKVDYDGTDIRIGTNKKEEKKPDAPKKPKTLDDLSFKQTASNVAILSISHSAQNTYSNSIKTDAAKKIFDIASSGDSETVMCGIDALRRISRSTYSNSVNSYCTELIGKLGIIAAEKQQEEHTILTVNVGEDEDDKMEETSNE